MVIRLRQTEEVDLDYILSAENNEENRQYIIPWSREKHLQAMNTPDILHLIVQKEARVGYAILAGLTNVNNTIELRRIVITEKGKGYGKATIGMIKELAFNNYRAHRLWLDVKLQNLRAQSIYKAAGFVVEGILRECLKTGDKYDSLMIMSILQQEYKNN
ncbi:GNAT family N-acetyltransferase [Calothrix sp. HK-06]|nr:GNAT family N-acetyltransferase [Calothrix sp. HK-06]